MLTESIQGNNKSKKQSIEYQPAYVIYVTQVDDEAGVNDPKFRDEEVSIRSNTSFGVSNHDSDDEHSIDSQIDNDIQNDHKNLEEKPKIIVKKKNIISSNKPIPKINRIKMKTDLLPKTLKPSSKNEVNKGEL